MPRIATVALLVATIAAGCSESTTPQYQPPPAAAAPAVDLIGSWRLTGGTVDSAEVVEAPDLPITVVFTATTAGGSAGCNGYTAQLSVSGAQLQLSNFVITEIACDDTVAALAEERFLAGLRRTTTISAEDGELVLSGPGIELRFRPGTAATSAE